MSTDNIQTIQSVEPVRVQTAQSSDVRSTSVSETIPETVAERNKAATSGQELPLDEATEAENTHEIEVAVSKISEFVQNFQRDLTFSVDDATGRTVIKVIDSATEEVIRTIPSEETLRMAESLSSPESLILREQA